MILAEVESVVSYQVVTVSLVSLLVAMTAVFAAVLGYAARHFFNKLEEVFKKVEETNKTIQTGAVDREGIKKDIAVLQRDVSEVKSLIDIKGAMREVQKTVQTLVDQTGKGGA